MASESYFKSTFCNQIENEWKGKLSQTKAQIVWNSVKAMNDDALKAALLKILRETSFPGVDKIIEYCSQENTYSRKMDLSKAFSEGCGLCNSGVRQVNGYAYKCSCKLGSMMFPNFPEYQGQAQFQEKRWEETEDGVVFEFHETATTIYIRKKGSKEIKDCRFIMKDQAPAMPKQDLSKPKLIKSDRFDMDRF